METVLDFDPSQEFVIQNAGAIEILGHWKNERNRAGFEDCGNLILNRMAAISMANKWPVPIVKLFISWIFSPSKAYHPFWGRYPVSNLKSVEKWYERILIRGHAADDAYRYIFTGKMLVSENILAHMADSVEGNH